MNDDVFKSKTLSELYGSLLAEAAKTQNELRCSQRDIDKALSRMSFILVLINYLLDKEHDNLKGD